MSFSRVFLALGLLLGMAGCAQPVQVDPIGGAVIKSSGVPAGEVTFRVVLDASAFDASKPIRVLVWDQVQLARSEANEGCMASYDPATEKTVTQCPPGVTYQETTPEEWTFTRAELEVGLTVPSKTVTVGERFRLMLTGTTAYDCSTASADAEGLAGGAEVAVEQMTVMVTQQDCETLPNNLPGAEPAP